MRLLAALVLFACTSSGRDAARAPSRPPLAPVGALTLGEAPDAIPSVVSGVHLGMDRAALLAARPRAYESRIRSGHFHEEIAANLSAHYTFHRGRLHAVLLRQSDASASAPRLREEARRRWGPPIRTLGSDLFASPTALVRVEADLGNLVVEVSDARGIPRRR